MFVFFDEMPANAKVWLYPCSTTLSNELVESIQKDIECFVEEWLSHKRIVKGSGSVIANRIIVLAADEQEVDVSGCSIDSSVRFIKSIEEKYQIQCFDRTQMIYLKDGVAHSIDFRNIAKAIEAGELNDDTLVFNIQAQNVSQVENAWWPLSASPYARFIS